MNSKQKEKIRKYRLHGLGYSKIANLMYLSKSTVAAHCKRHGLRPSDICRDIKTSDHKELFCKNCGAQLIQSSMGKPKKFCCDECRQNWWNANIDTCDKKAFYLITCKKCNEVFKSYGNKNRKYCSHGCYVDDVFTEKRESIQAISIIISEFYTEVSDITLCERAKVCNNYSGNLLSNAAVSKVIRKAATSIYNLQNNRKEET